MIQAMTDDSEVHVRINGQGNSVPIKCMFLEELYWIILRAIEAGIANENEVREMTELALKLSQKGVRHDN